MLITRKTPRNVKKLIVDFEATIVNSSPIFTARMNGVGDEFGYGRIDASFSLRDKSAHDFCNEHLGLSGERLLQWTDRFKVLLKSAMRTAVPFKDMKELLGRLSAYYRIRIFTSNSEEVVRYVMAKHDFRPVDFIHSGIPILEKDKALKVLLLSEGSFTTRNDLYRG